MSTCTPAWAKQLQRRGNYYEGVVEDFDSLFEEFKQQTVTTWGTRRSSTSQPLQVIQESTKDQDQHVHVHWTTSMHTHTHKHTRYLCVSVSMYVCTYARMYVCMYVCTLTFEAIIIDISNACDSMAKA